MPHKGHMLAAECPSRCFMGGGAGKMEMAPETRVKTERNMIRIDFGRDALFTGGGGNRASCTTPNGDTISIPPHTSSKWKLGQVGGSHNYAHLPGLHFDKLRRLLSQFLMSKPNPRALRQGIRMR